MIDDGLSENEKEEIRKAIWDAIYKWDSQANEIYNMILDGSESPNKLQIIENDFLKYCFIFKYSWEPGFYAFVEKEIKETNRYQQCYKDLVRASIIDLINGSFTIADFKEEKKIKEDCGDVKNNPEKNQDEERKISSNIIRRTQQNRMKRIFAEFFYQPRINNRSDERNRPYSTVFSPLMDDLNISPSINPNISSKYDKEEFEKRERWAMILKMVHLPYLQDVDQFRKDMMDVTSNINNDQVFHEAKKSFIKEELSKFGNIQSRFHYTVHLCVAKVWWNNKKNEKKYRILATKYPYKLVRKSGIPAVNLLFKFGMSQEQIGRLIIFMSRELIRPSFNGIYPVADAFEKEMDREKRDNDEIELDAHDKKNRSMVIGWLKGISSQLDETKYPSLRQAVLLSLGESRMKQTV